jgi:hypothetical protein
MRRSTAPKKKATKKPKAASGGSRYWSARVTETSNALDLESGVFTLDDPREISRSLLQSARESKRRKATSPYRSAMSMLTFYINRAGKRLPPQRRRILEQAKEELRKLRDREDTR